MPERGSVIANFIKVTAERKLQNVAISICQNLTPDHMETMANKNQTLGQVIRDLGYSMPKVSLLARPGVDYLAHLSDEEILGILEEVVPDNVTVLRRHPAFCASIIRDFKSFAK